MRPFQVIVLAALALFPLSCSRFDPPAVFNLQSVNVASLPPGWPEHMALTPAQERVLEERGNPDYLRARWDRRGNFTWGDEVWTTHHRSRVIDIMLTAHHHDRPIPFEISWLFQEEGQHRTRRGPDEVFRGEEVVFLSEEEFEVEEILPQLGVIIDYGDPEERRQPRQWEGHSLNSWIYFHEGKIFHFMDDALEQVESIPPTPIRVRPEI
jgi:hypothetical protein